MVAAFTAKHVSVSRINLVQDIGRTLEATLTFREVNQQLGGQIVLKGWQLFLGKYSLKTSKIGFENRVQFQKLLNVTSFIHNLIQ